MELNIRNIEQEQERIFIKVGKRKQIMSSEPQFEGRWKKANHKSNNKRGLIQNKLRR